MARLKCTMLIPICVFIISSACIMGEGGFKIKGSVRDTNGTPLDKCILELHIAVDGKRLGYREISTNFEESFVISPSEHEYFLIIECPEIAKMHKTGIYKVTGSNYYEQPLDLGVIIPTRPLSDKKRAGSDLTN